MAYLCDNDPDTAAVLIITNLDSGDTIALCGPCVHPWTAAMAAATAPVDETTEPPGNPDELADADTDDDQAGDESGTTSPAPDPTPEPVTPEPVAPADDEPEPGFSSSTVAAALNDASADYQPAATSG